MGVVGLAFVGCVEAFAEDVDFFPCAAPWEVECSHAWAGVGFYPCDGVSACGFGDAPCSEDHGWFVGAPVGDEFVAGVGGVVACDGFLFVAVSSVFHSVGWVGDEDVGLVEEVEVVAVVVVD